MARDKAVLLSLAMFLSSPACALDGDNVSVEKQDRVWVVRATFDVDANANQVRSVLTDFRNPARLNSAVTGREILGRQHGLVRVSTEFRGCALFFCRTMTLVQDVAVSDASVRADVVPEGSDFRSGYLLWSIGARRGGGAHVVLQAAMEPDFFVPPLIGGLLVRRALKKQVDEIARNLAREAALEPSLPAAE